MGIFYFNGFLGHNGGIFGYRTFVGYLPEADAAIIVLVNRGGTEGGDADAIFLGIAQTHFPERFPR